MDKFEKRVRITGIGLSDIGRRLDRDPVGLAVDACIAAMRDAGLERKDIDGLSCHPGPFQLDGYSGAGVQDVEQVLQVNPRWFSSGHEMSGHTGSVINAMLAVAAGLARHVIVFRCTWDTTSHLWEARGMGPDRPLKIVDDYQYQIPFGALSAANWIAMYATRHMHIYGTTREQLGAIAVNARANAMLNPYAIYRTPLTLDEYLNARMISTPFGLYDCDTPCDGAVAIIVSAADAARDTRRPRPLRVEAVGTQIIEKWSWDNGGLAHLPLVRGAAKSLWERTDLKPADVDVAELYDGFTFNALTWLELLGFCPEGEGGRFVEGATRIARDGQLPMNTHGGQLSGGRLHGFSFLHEACVQLWGEGGERQVPNSPQVAVATSGGGAAGGAILLTAG